MIFKLLGGVHITADPNAPEVPAGVPKAEKVYKAGDLIETDKDLAAQFGTNRFQLVSSEPMRRPTPQVQDKAPSHQPAVNQPAGRNK